MSNPVRLSLKDRRIFVTGGAGFIGSTVVKSLLAAGATVRCLLRPNTVTQRIDGLKLEVARGDVRDARSVAVGMASCEAVVHLAGIVSWSLIDSPEMRDVTVAGTANILDAAAGQSVRDVVYVSTAAAVGASENPDVVFDETAPYGLAGSGLSYSECKHEADQLCIRALERGLRTVIVCPTEVYGPDDTAMVTAANLVDFARSWPVLICSGGTSIVHVDDVATGIVRALECGRAGERYILGGENLSVRELATLTLELLGRKKPILSVPNSALRVLARGSLRFGFPLPLNPRVVPYATRYWYMDSSKARTELGVTFRGARETLMPTLRWLAQAGLIRAARGVRSQLLTS